MSVCLRLKRIGMPKQPHYRLVAIPRRNARNGKELEVLGHYNPRGKENSLVIKSERIEYWLSCGARPSDTVKSLLTRIGFFSKAKIEPAASATQPEEPANNP